MATIFTRIRTGEIPGYILEDTGKFFVFLDNAPQQRGHLLVVPYQEVDDIFDLDSETYHQLWDGVAMVSAKLRKIVPCRKVAVMVKGLQVNHVHVHLVPINAESDLESQYTPEPDEFAQLQDQYRSL